MLKNLLVHPFLFSLFPVLFLFQYNIHEIPLQDVFLPLFFSFVVGFTLWIVLRFFIGGKKAGLITSLVIMLFIIFSNLHMFILNSNTDFSFLGRTSILGATMLALLVVGIVYLIKSKRIFDNLNSITNVIALSLIGFLVMSISVYYVENPIDYSITYFSEELPDSIDNVTIKPDIYYFIFDEYAGHVTLEQDFDYDNSAFLKELDERGFHVPDISYSNYPNSLESIASTLNMGYLDILTEELGQNSKDLRLPTEIRDNNLAMNFLKLYDYKIVSFYGGLGAAGTTALVNEKLCSYLGINNDLRTKFILTYFPITYLNDSLIHANHREKIECVFSTAPNIRGTDEEAVFVMAHFLFPHEPYIYDSKGNPVSERKAWEDKDAYLQQLQYANTRILELVDKTLENSDRESVIIVMSDHGFRPGTDWENPSQENYRAVFNNLGAYYIPNQINDMPETISGVNVFRIIFNSYFGTEYELLEDKQFFFNPEKPFIYFDVSGNLSG